MFTIIIIIILSNSIEMGWSRKLQSSLIITMCCHAVHGYATSVRPLGGVMNTETCNFSETMQDRTKVTTTSLTMFVFVVTAKQWSVGI